MHTLFTISLIVISLILIVSVLLQSGKSSGFSGAVLGEAEQMFGKQKTKGIDLILHRATIVLATLFVVLSIVVVKV